MFACSGGWTLDGFDQQLYSYVAPHSYRVRWFL